MRNAYDDKWEFVRRLGRGGQGYTHLVKSRDDGRSAVAKTLRNSKSAKARGRMQTEVASLKAVHGVGARVPSVFEHNTDAAENMNVALFFVMQHIEGDTLEDFVKERGSMEFDAALDLVLDLAESLKKGHDLDIQHRDLKPDNVIVTGDGPVIVDYGLSFNKELDANLTRDGENFGSQFIILPETRAPGSNHRDPRSDIAALCGVLYFCLSGEFPGVLQDERGLAPHRRTEKWARGDVIQDARFRPLMMALDRGLKQDIESRFQTIEECISRLSQVKCGVSTDLDTPLDPAQLEQQLRPQLLRKYKVLHLNSLRPIAEAANRCIIDEFQACRNGLKLFATEVTSQIQPFKMPHGVDQIGDPAVILFKPPVITEQCVWRACFFFGVQGDQVGVFCGVATNRGKAVTIEVEPTVLLWLTALPDDTDKRVLQLAARKRFTDGMQAVLTLDPNTP